MSRYLATLCVCAVVWFGTDSQAHAAADNWKFGLNANWENGGAWLDGSTPGNADSATLGFASTYTATFGVSPAAVHSGRSVTSFASGMAVFAFQVFTACSAAASVG